MTVKTKNDIPKERILKAAKELFARKGFANTGVRELSEAASVNVSAINYFFGSKKGLLINIIEEFFSGYIDIMESELLRDVCLEQKLDRFIRRSIDYISAKRHSMIITMVEFLQNEPDITKHKSRLVLKAMDAIENGICIPIKKTRGVNISSVTIGPLFFGIMSSRFLFEPIVKQLSPPGFTANFFTEYPTIISTILLSGIEGLILKNPMNSWEK